MSGAATGRHLYSSEASCTAWSHVAAPLPQTLSTSSFQNLKEENQKENQQSVALFRDAVIFTTIPGSAISTDTCTPIQQHKLTLLVCRNPCCPPAIAHTDLTNDRCNKCTGLRVTTHTHTHRHKVGACEVPDDPRGGADAHVTDEGKHPPARSNTQPEQGEGKGEGQRWNRGRGGQRATDRESLY